MTHEELQHLHDRYKQTGRYSHLVAIAYLKAKLADVEAGRDQEAES